MALKLSIADVIGVKVAGNYRDAGGNSVPFKFVLVCKRLKAQQLQDAMADKDETVAAFFEVQASDWKEQTLVLDESGAPASFGLDALRCMFGIPGMAATCWRAYVEQVGVTSKN